MNRWAEVTLVVPAECEEPAAAVLTASGCAGVLVRDPAAVSSDPLADWVLEEGKPPPPSPGRPIRVTGYLPVDDRLEAALLDLRERIEVLRRHGIEAPEHVAVRTIEEEAWAEAWKAHFKPRRIGRRLVVKPSWEPYEPAGDDLVVEIDPGMAFGSGCHESTRLCMRLLEERVRPGERLLDWGTGTGILALAALRLGASEALAIDLDPAAVRIAAGNAERNGLSRAMRTAVASIEDVEECEPFDRIVANLVAGPILAGAAEIRRRLRTGGEAIASGIVAQREEEVRAGLRAAGLEPAASLAEGDWRALLFRAA